MMKSKIIRSIIIYFTVYVFIMIGIILMQPRYFNGHSLLDIHVFQLLMEMDSGFYSYIIIFFTALPLTILLLEYMITKTEEIIIIRQRSYFQYAVYHLKLSVINGFTSSLIYVGIVSSIMTISFDLKKLLEYGFIEITLHMTIAMILLYTWSSLLYLIFRRLTNRKMNALIILMVSVVTQIALFYAVPTIERLFIPIENVIAYSSILLHLYDQRSILYLDFRDGFFCIFLFVLYYLVLERKDVLSFEAEN